MARVGVFIGQFNSGSRIAFDALASYAANLRAVEKVRLLGFRPKVDVKAMAEEIRREQLDRIVLAGDSPGHFKPAVTRAMQLAGGDPGEVRLASFREHGADSTDATDRAKAVLACAVQGVPYPLVAVAKPTVVNPATLIIGVAILFEAGLSFLGLSDPTGMSWGLMIGSLRRNILECWWGVTFPGIAIFVTVLAVSLIGDGLNDAFNPKLHQR